MQAEKRSIASISTTGSGSQNLVINEADGISLLGQAINSLTVNGNQNTLTPGVVSVDAPISVPTIIVNGAAGLGVDLDEHITFCIEAMKGIAGELGLQGKG